MANCVVCRADLSSKSKIPSGDSDNKGGKVSEPKTIQCPHCNSENQTKRENTWGWYFLKRPPWGILSVVVPFALLLLLRPKPRGWFADVASLSVAVPISCILTLVSAFFLLSMRDDLLQERQARTFKENQGPSLSRLALMFFLASVVLGFIVGFVVAAQDALIGFGPAQLEPGSTGHVLLKFAMTGCMVLMFACFVLAAGLMAVYEFGLYAEAHMPIPIFLNEQLMKDVVLSAVQRYISDIGISVEKRVRQDAGAGSQPQGVGNAGQSQDAENGDKVQLFLIRMERTADAGMKLLLHEKREIRPTGKDKEQEPWLDEKRWQVEADLWVRLTKVVELGPRTIKVQKAEQ